MESGTLRVGNREWDSRKWDLWSGRLRVGIREWDTESGTRRVGHGEWDCRKWYLGSGTAEGGTHRVGHGVWDTVSGTQRVVVMVIVVEPGMALIIVTVHHLVLYNFYCVYI